MKNFQLTPPDDPLYVVRKSDSALERALQEGSRLIRITGPPRTGKSALLSRALQSLANAGQRVVLLNLAAADPAHLEATEPVCRFVMRETARQLGLPAPFKADADSPNWEIQRSPFTNLERYLRRNVLPAEAPPFHLCWDAGERLAASTPGEEMDGLLRSWCGEAALYPVGCRHPFSIVAANGNLSIGEAFGGLERYSDTFNVGIRIEAGSLTPDELRDLNRRGGWLKEGDELERFHRLFGGQPYLVRIALEFLRERGGGLAALEAMADDPHAPWAGFLDQLGRQLDTVPEARQFVGDLLAGRPPAATASSWKGCWRAGGCPGLVTRC